LCNGLVMSRKISVPPGNNIVKYKPRVGGEGGGGFQLLLAKRRTNIIGHRQIRKIIPVMWKFSWYKIKLTENFGTKITTRKS